MKTSFKIFHLFIYYSPHLIFTLTNSASDPESAKTNCNATLKSLNEQRYEQIKQSSYFWIDRSEHCTVDKTVRRVAEHFQFAG